MRFEALWEALCSRQGEVFYTARRRPFTYVIHGGVLKVDRKARPITRASVRLAQEVAQAMEGRIPGPKALGCFGASYIYPIFVQLGLIEAECDKRTPGVLLKKSPMTEEEGGKMSRPKGSRNKPTPTIDERVAAAEAKVDELKRALAEAEEELKKLTALRDEEAVKALVDAIAESGKSIGDVIAMVKGEARDA